jgi:transposase-like protein
MRLKRRNDPDERALWSRHAALWMRSPFSQQEYRERNGISRSLMSKWWICLREDRAREERFKIARCPGRSRRSTITGEASHRTNEGISVSPAMFLKETADRPIVRRRRFTDEEKRHFLDLANRPGSSVSDVHRAAEPVDGRPDTDTLALLDHGHKTAPFGMPRA